MPHPMARLCDRFRLKEFDFHSPLHAEVLRICRRAQVRFRLSRLDVSLWQRDTYIWRPRQGFQTDIYGPCVRSRGRRTNCFLVRWFSRAVPYVFTLESVFGVGYAAVKLSETNLFFVRTRR